MKRSIIIVATFVMTLFGHMATAADVIDWNDNDMRSICAAVKTVTNGSIFVIDPPRAICRYTTSPDCHCEVNVAIADDPAVRQLAISKINDEWVIGDLQKQIVLLDRCLANAKKKLNEAEQMKTQSRRTYRNEIQQCHKKYPRILSTQLLANGSKNKPD